MAARMAAENAHCPYSHFRVGAAVETRERIFCGANVENASYGLTLCAERAALATAIAAGATAIQAIAIACIDAAKELGDAGRMPCGACRQWMAELAPDAVIHIDGIDWTYTVSELLPNPFKL